MQASVVPIKKTPCNLNPAAAPAAKEPTSSEKRQPKSITPRLRKPSGANCGMIGRMATARETFLYFAYGSNMLTRRLSRRTHSAAAVATAHVEGYRLAFDKVSTDGSGKCTIEPTGNVADRVWRVLFRIATAESADLDDAEGLGHGYRKGEVEAVAATARTQAVAYFATQRQPALCPYDWYKAFVVQGAIEHQLPADYIERLRSIVSYPDPDPARRAWNEGILQLID